VLRQNTRDIELNGFKISAVEDAESQSKSKKLIFLHGLLGQGRNWRSFALNDVVRNSNMILYLDFFEERCLPSRP
jgi:hypothetical protein